MLRIEYFFHKLKRNFIISLRSKGKVAFLNNLSSFSKILDVGCGNNSPYKTKLILPNCHYTGIDVQDYNLVNKNVADKYIIASPLNFSNKINEFNNFFDAVISSHNLEHCYNANDVLLAMINSLKVGGMIYLSFPCEESINFPKRGGTLNYYDDSSHSLDVPIFKNIISLLINNNMEVIFEDKRYQPLILRIIGFFMEPFSVFLDKCLIGTWEYHGFESVIQAKKISSTN